MDRITGQSDTAGEKSRPKWRTPQLKIDSVAGVTRHDLGAPGDDGSKHPNHGTNS